MVDPTDPKEVKSEQNDKKSWKFIEKKLLEK